MKRLFRVHEAAAGAKNVTRFRPFLADLLTTRARHDFLATHLFAFLSFCISYTHGDSFL